MINSIPPNLPSNEADLAKDQHHSYPEILLNKIKQLADLLSISPKEIELWLSSYSSLPTSTGLSLIHLAIKYQLDPLMGEVSLWTDHQGQAHPSISIDGWMRIINQHPAFIGIQFTETSIEDKGPPQSISCTIYRNDRHLPTHVSEYLEEVKNDHPLWKTMPRRMLRHRVMQQCARLAFGISTPEFALPEHSVNVASVSNDIPSEKGVSLSTSNPGGLGSSHASPQPSSRTTQLKERLLKTKSSLAPSLPTGTKQTFDVIVPHSQSLVKE